jgi:mono/diheme cytochrome c family protein
MPRRPDAPRWTGPGLALLLAWPLTLQAAGPDDVRLFREKVAPVLEKRCVSCHGAETAKGNFSLATAAALLKGGDAGAAVVPGKPDDSPLVEAVTGDPPAMPKKGERLTAAEVADLRAWVEHGATWPAGLTLRDRRFEGQSWWAFQPLTRPPVPAVPQKYQDRARNPIDAFVLDGLESQGLTPSPEADRRTLIRRLTLDLHGLPPSPGEVEAFVADPSPDAYERLVDRLLASPRYGERLARHWLDVVHYGDTHGYDKDKRRDNAWPYRDYVIRALNTDTPYGKFARQQIAGDVLDPGDPDGVIATGFVAAGPWDFVGHVELREGTVDKAKARLNDRDDMVVNVITTFDSMTVGCARCHDHKFDPIPQTDYYRLQAVFAGVDRGDRPYSSPALDAERRRLMESRDELNDRYQKARDRINAVTSPEIARLDETIEDIERQLGDKPRPTSASSPTNGYHSSIHPTPDAFAWVQVDLGASVPVDEIRLIPARPTDFPDNAGFGFPVKYKVEISDDPTFAKAETVDEGARPDYLNADDEPYVCRPGGRPARYVRVSASRLWKRTDDFVFALAELEVMTHGANVARGKPVAALDSIEAGRWSRTALVDGFDSRSARPDPTDALDARRVELRFQQARAERERARLADALVSPSLKAEAESLAAERKAVEDKLAGLKPAGLVYGLLPHAPRPIQVLRRGDVEQPGPAVGPGALACLPGLEPVFTSASSEDEGARRAALADWVASPKNMLTWRSIVNRLWHVHFGRGIVDSPGDFGRNGSKPTHPALLDWLAVELLENGQSLKHLHRLIVTSAAYRQVSHADPARDAKDADNRWLWRQNRRRLDAESVRDAVLAVTGTLDGTMYGPGFDLFRFKDDHSPIYDHTAPGAADNPKVRRRTVYRFTVRSVPNPFLECLDAADPNINTPVRSTTITALQALALLNDAFVLSQSREFAGRLENEGQGADLASMVETAYRLALGRPPRPDEKAALAAFAAKFGLAGACRVLLNTNEFMFVD